MTKKLIKKLYIYKKNLKFLFNFFVKFLKLIK